MMNFSNDQLNLLEMALRIAGDTMLLAAIENKSNAESTPYEFCRVDYTVMAQKQRNRVAEFEALRQAVMVARAATEEA